MRTLSDLLRTAYPEYADEDIKKLIKVARKGELNCGIIWERITKEKLGLEPLRPNSSWRDHIDGTDSKFCSVVRMNNRENKPNCFQATVSTRNKIGQLRVCMWDPFFADNLYFMLIPYEYFIKYNGNPIKITFQNFMPKGPHWDKWQCTFEQVVAQVDNNSKEIYNNRMLTMDKKFTSQA